SGRGGLSIRGVLASFDAREREMRIKPAELAIVQFGMQCNLIARIFRNVQTKVRGVRGARGNEMDVNNGACRPRISFVNRIAVPVDLQRTVEVRPGLDRAFAVVLDLPAPENH